VESNDSDDALTSSENQTNPEGKLGGKDWESNPLQIEVDHADSPGESIQVNLGDIPGEDVTPSEVKITFDLKDDTRVRVTVESLPSLEDENGAQIGHNEQVVIESQGDKAHILDSQTQVMSIPKRLKAYLLSWPFSLQLTLFGLALLVYLLTHLVGLTRFPIYFFTDEAIQTVSAANLVRDNFLDEQGIFLPTYFKNGPYYNLSVSVYLQVLPYLLFGKSAFITRATSVLVSLLAAVSIGLTLRDFFKIPYWWVGVPLLSIAPAWFLHSRTAFETVIFCSFYAAFLYLYLLYRYQSARYLYYAILLAALAFYAYSPGQIIIALTGLLLLLSDARYHWKNRSTLIRGLGLIVILALPYLRFRLQRPDAPFEQLRILDSYWLQNIPLKDKLTQYGREYLYGLSPGYWFLPNERDLPRHLMKGYGHLLRASLPFAILGLYFTLRGVKSSANRVLLIALLVAPVAAALVQIGITRVLVYIIPATILIAIGLSKTLTWLEKVRLSRVGLSIAVFLLLTFINLSMLQDTLTNSPTWYEDYGLGGMQYGAHQLFPEIAAYLDSDPDLEILLTPTWANGTDVVARFFLGDPLPIKMGSIDGHMFQRLPLDKNTLFVMTAAEYQLMLDSGKFEVDQVADRLPYPNGETGFYFVHLNYVDEVDSIFEAEREQRRELRSNEVALDGEMVPVRYSLLDIGEIGHMFDGDRHTLARTFEANPAIVELNFPNQRPVSGVSIIIGSTEAEVKAWLNPDSESQELEYVKIFQGTEQQPEVTFDFGTSTRVSSMRLEIRDLRQAEPGNVHVWEISIIK
jgi:4-amino-4-deoxy-L-arabinose transferase-like glycosyltransferase